MLIEVNGELIEFPDSMSPEDIAQAIQGMSDVVPDIPVPKGLTEKDYEDSAPEWMQNLIPSTIRLANDTAEGIGRLATSPVDTLSGLIPGMAQHYGDRYGSWDSIQQAWNEDPAGVLSDVSVAGTLIKAPAMVAKSVGKAGIRRATSQIDNIDPRSATSFEDFTQANRAKTASQKLVERAEQLRSAGNVIETLDPITALSSVGDIAMTGGQAAMGRTAADNVGYRYGPPSSRFKHDLGGYEGTVAEAVRRGLEPNRSGAARLGIDIEEAAKAVRREAAMSGVEIPVDRVREAILDASKDGVFDFTTEAFNKVVDDLSNQFEGLVDTNASARAGKAAERAGFVRVIDDTVRLDIDELSRQALDSGIPPDQVRTILDGVPDQLKAIDAQNVIQQIQSVSDGFGGNAQMFGRDVAGRIHIAVLDAVERRRSSVKNELQNDIPLTDVVDMRQSLDDRINWNNPNAQESISNSANRSVANNLRGIINETEAVRKANEEFSTLSDIQYILNPGAARDIRSQGRNLIRDLGASVANTAADASKYILTGKPEFERARGLQMLNDGNWVGYLGSTLGSGPIGEARRVGTQVERYSDDNEQNFRGSESDWDVNALEGPLKDRWATLPDRLSQYDNGERVGVALTALSRRGDSAKQAAEQLLRLAKDPGVRSRLADVPVYTWSKADGKELKSILTSLGVNFKRAPALL